MLSLVCNLGKYKPFKISLFMKVLRHVLHLLLQEVPVGNLLLGLILLDVSLTRETLDGFLACALEALDLLVERLNV
jgi:hypothetical protein